ncbi:chorismate mutase [Streptacidiphilus sp. ASG 303]|uniref:chorismate mutase n=1 Tax=Streptacidiphilus sp. ASG 303 TaxID=2896847 RepID=UPI001E58232D|nr:chorismate mutase [Streptacidiphilus sp. ASG 303]MCD0481922.1 chorismate mutase [Streptacidiphilus sp. ASG 303]
MNADTTPAAPAPTPAAPAVDADGAEAVIAAARSRIDDLDARIIDLVRQRRAASAEVQAARIAAGGPRLALTRELQVMERFRAGLGDPGAEVARLLLELCRGRA